MKRRLLWIGDAAVATGFAKCTHKTLEAFRDWDVHVLGLNYNGDPHAFPFPIYPPWIGGDPYGLRRTGELVTKIRPDVVLIQNDPWNIAPYMKEAGNAPCVASMPVDGKNCKGAALNGLALAIFWTKFGELEAQCGGYTGASTVIPLGVDLHTYSPGDRLRARVNLKLPEEALNGFIVGNVNRNQPRKRIDLTISYFAEWVHKYNIRDAYLFLHVAPTRDQGWDVGQLMKYYRIPNRLILQEPEVGLGIAEPILVETYRAFDVQISTTQGEGWGLCTMEGMACGCPQIVPNWSALGEWVTDGAAIKVPCSEVAMTPNNINAIGGIPDRAAFIEALNKMYQEREVRETYATAGLDLVSEPRFRWETIGEQFRTCLEELV